MATEAGARGDPWYKKLGKTVAAQVLIGAGKDQILEAYLNLVPFRGEVVGIDALSRTCLAKQPMARKTARQPWPPLVRAPTRRPALVAQRAWGLGPMQQPPAKWRGGLRCAGPFTTAALQRRASDATEGVQRRTLRAMPAPAGKRGADPDSGAHLPRALHPQLPAPLRALAAAFCHPNPSSTWRELRGRNVEDGARCWCWTTPRVQCWRGWGSVRAS